MELFRIIATAMVIFKPRTSHDVWLPAKNSVLMINSTQRDMTAPSSTKWASCNGGTLASILDETGEQWKETRGFLIWKKMTGFSFIAMKQPSTEYGLPKQQQIILDQWRRWNEDKWSVHTRTAFFLSSNQTTKAWIPFLSKIKSKLHLIFFFPAHLEKLTMSLTVVCLRISKNTRISKRENRCSYLGW